MNSSGSICTHRAREHFGQRPKIEAYDDFTFLVLFGAAPPPDEVISGFFGQNFGWMVEHVDSWPAFVGLGIGLEVTAVVILLVYFKRRGWF